MPQTLSKSTPKDLAACKTEVPIGKFPFLPDGVNITFGCLLGIFDLYSQLLLINKYFFKKENRKDGN